MGEDTLNITGRHIDLNAQTVLALFSSLGCMSLTCFGHEVVSKSQAAGPRSVAASHLKHISSGSPQTRTLPVSQIFIDVDECSIDTHLCAHNCTNYIGSYLCSCGVGYRLNADGFQCDGKPAWFATARTGDK